MDILRARVVFRERSLLDVLDLALRFLVVHVKPYAIVAAATLLPSLGITWAAGHFLGWAVAWGTGIFLAFATAIPFTLLASRLVFQDDVKATAVLASSLREVPRVLFARVLWLVLVAIASIFVLPLIWVGTAYLFTDEVLLLERASIGASFKRSQAVATTSFGDAFLAVFVFATTVFGAVALADYGGRSVIGELLQIEPPRSLWTEGGSLLAIVGLFAIVPFVTTARFFAYLNIRTRSEGWDIQIRFSEIASRAQQELS